MADRAANTVITQHPLTALWRMVTRLESSKINDWWMALRNALAVAIPLTVGIEMGNSLAAVALAIGALNVSYSDGRDPYRQRAQRMLLWSALSGFSVFVGVITGQSRFSAVLVATVWAFIAGMMLALSGQAGDLGLTTLVSVIVFAARGATTPAGAFYTGLLVFGGGLLQTALALLLWPVRRNKPQMLAIGQAFHELAAEVNPNADTPNFVPIRTPSAHLQETLSALGSDHTIEGDRLRLLFDQADRLRLSIYLVNRLRDELGEGDSQQTELEGDAADDLDQFLKGASKLLETVGDVLITDNSSPEVDALRSHLVELVERAQIRKHDPQFQPGQRIASAIDVVVGQLRLVVQLASNTTERGGSEFLKGVHAKPWKLRSESWRAAIRANLTWRSPVFRHAVRLSLCIGVADIIGRSISWQRAYWIPMTAAVVLKPDFATTFSRGTLRLAGTIGGLILATGIYHLLPASGWSQLFLVGIFTFFLRYLGPANYGVFTVAVSGLIVFLLAATGVSPAQVVLLRGVNTIAGGMLALLAYAIWPTWERSTISDSVAEMLDTLRLYFRGVSQNFTVDEGHDTALLDRERTNWRLKRSSAEAAVDRVTSEPGNSRAKSECLSSMMASSHALVNAVMGLEAGHMKSALKTAPEAFRIFANDVEFTLYYLSSALRGSEFASRSLPQLREDHRRLLEARDAFSPLDEYVLIETDRLTVSLNTLREQVMRYISGC